MEQQQEPTVQRKVFQTPTRANIPFDYYYPHEDQNNGETSTPLIGGRRLFSNSESINVETSHIQSHRATPVARAHRSSGYSSSHKKSRPLIKDDVTPASSRAKNLKSSGNHKKQS